MISLRKNNNTMENSYNKLNEIIKGANFRKVISAIAYEDFCFHNLTRKKSIHRFNEREFQYILAMWLTNYNIPNNDISPDKIDSTIQNIRAEINKIHMSFYDSVAVYSNLSTQINSDKTVYDEVLYGGSGYIDLEIIDYIEQKYTYDKKWILENKDIEINLLKQFYLDVFKLLTICMRSAVKIQPKKSISFNENLFVVRTSDIIKLNPKYAPIIDAFSVDINNMVNLNVKCISDFNPLVAFPLIKLDNNKLYIPLLSALANAMYEAPFYWRINSDKKYLKMNGAKIRGDVCEDITEKLILRLYDKSEVYKNIYFKTSNQTEGEIDVLVIHNGQAIIIQNKSKRLTQVSINGDIRKALDDVEKGIGNAHRQANEAEEAILDSCCIWSYNQDLKDKFDIPTVSNVVKVCITLDFFPAVDILTKRKLGITDLIPLSVFELSLVIKLNHSSLELCKYLKFRVSQKKYIGCNESYFLGLYRRIVNGDFSPYLVSDCRLSHELANDIDILVYSDLFNKYFPTLTVKSKKTGRNSWCSCGSGKKYKYCCLHK